MLTEVSEHAAESTARAGGKRNEWCATRPHTRNRNAVLIILSDWIGDRSIFARRRKRDFIGVMDFSDFAQKSSFFFFVFARWRQINAF